MKRMILVYCLCLAATPGYAEEHWITDKETVCQLIDYKDLPPDSAISWSGECKDGKANGKGMLKFYKKKKIGFTFDGTIKNGEFAYGILEVVNVMKYEGEFEDGIMNGNGTMTYKTGDKYSGSWLKGKQHGKGTYTFKDGTSYEGLWENGERIKIF